MFNIAGNMKISDLSSDQVTRLVRYVNDMLSRFEDSGMTAPSGKTGQNQSSDQPGNCLFTSALT